MPCGVAILMEEAPAGVEDAQADGGARHQESCRRGVSLLKSPSGSKVTPKRARSSAQPKTGQAETSRIILGVSPPGIDRAARRRNLPLRIETIRHCEGQVTVSS